MSFDIYSARTAHITAMIAPIASQGQTYCIRLLWSGSSAIPKSLLWWAEFVTAADANDKKNWPCWWVLWNVPLEQMPSVGVFLRVR